MLRNWNEEKHKKSAYIIFIIICELGVNEELKVWMQSIFIILFCFAILIQYKFIPWCNVLDWLVVHSKQISWRCGTKYSARVLQIMLRSSIIYAQNMASNSEEHLLLRLLLLDLDRCRSKYEACLLVDIVQIGVAIFWTSLVSSWPFELDSRRF